VNNPDPQPKPALLAVQDLHKSFVDSGATIHVLRGATFALQEGDNLAITGQSGCGKSTLLNTISGLERFDEGQVLWQGTAINTMPAAQLSRLRGRFFGFIFQAFYLVQELNTFENVLLPARLVGRVNKESSARASALLSQVGLGERLRHPVQKLSGGERQRVAIARALRNQPKVILADEPTGNLDERTADSVMQLIFDVCRDHGSSMILVTHNPAYAKLTDHRYLLHDGGITESL
jgi:lipoprotein-releasing system ATP-binding protein